MGLNRGTRRRGPIEIGGQDGALWGNQVNHFDGALHVNQYGMNHNTRKPYNEQLFGDKTFNIWEDLGKPIYFEVNVVCNKDYSVTLIGNKSWADRTTVDNLEADILCLPEEEIFIYDEEFEKLLVQICDPPETDTWIYIYASGFIPDAKGDNFYREKLEQDFRR